MEPPAASRIFWVNLSLLLRRYLARWLMSTLWPPYWLEATQEMIWVVTVQATWKLLGLSISLPFIMVPLSSISPMLIRQQLKMGWT